MLLGTPAIKALKQKYPSHSIFIYCLRKAQADVYRNNPYVAKVKTASFIYMPLDYLLYYLKLTKFHLTTYGSLLPSLYYEKNATEIIAEMLDVTLEDKRVQVWLTEDEEIWAKDFTSQYKKPVVIHISSLTSQNQEWPVGNWEQFVDELPECTFIQIGLSNEVPIKGTIDLRGKTTFRQALALLKYSMSFVGVVSAFSHATNAFNLPGVVLFGASSPKIWGHENNINLYTNLPCSPCIDLLYNSSCPYDKRCMTSITVLDVKKALLTQVGDRDQ